MTMADRIAVMNQGGSSSSGPGRAVRAATDGLRPGFLGISEPPSRTVAGPDAVRLGDGTTIRVRTARWQANRRCRGRHSP